MFAPLRNLLRGLSLEQKPGASSSSKLEGSSGEELLWEYDVTCMSYMEEARGRAASGKVLAENDTSLLPEQREKQLLELEDILTNLDNFERLAAKYRSPNFVHKFWLLKNHGLKKRATQWRRLIDEVSQQSESAKAKTLNNIKGHGKILYPSMRTITRGLGNGYITSLETEGNRNDRESFIATPHTPIRNASTGLVYKGTHLLFDGKQFHSSLVAVKTVILSDEKGFDKEEQIERRIEREAELWYTLSQQDHPNIQPFFGDFQGTEARRDGDSQTAGRPRLHLVSPWASGRDVRKFFDRDSDNRKVHGLKLVGDVILGLEFLHGDIGYLTGDPKERLAHGDVHPGNILVHEPQGPGKPLAWLADFGLSAFQEEEATTFLTQKNYRAPELRDLEEDLRSISEMTDEERQSYLQERKSRAEKLEKADVYSFGFTALFMLTGKETDHRREENRQKLLVPKPGEPHVSEGMYDLIRRCCRIEPSERPTMAEVKEECRDLNLAPLEDGANRQAILQPSPD